MSHIKIESVCLDNSTIGMLTVALGNFRCFTLELPWLNNKPNVSCIYSGVFYYVKRVSPTLGEVIHILDVHGRTWIYIHKGNFTYQIEGCILVGTGIRDLDDDGVPDVTNSEKAFKELMLVTDVRGTVEIIDERRKRGQL